MCFVKANFSVPDHPIGGMCGIGTSKRFWGDQGILHSANFVQTPIQVAGFLQVLPKSLFKKHVLSTRLWQYAKMSTALKAPGGLKNSKCKKGQLSNRPPIPYVAEMDIVRSKEEPQVFKVWGFRMIPISICPSTPVGTPRNTLHTSLQSSASSSRSRMGRTQSAGRLERL